MNENIAEKLVIWGVCVCVCVCVFPKAYESCLFYIFFY
jgi:hypothetical protein